MVPSIRWSSSEATISRIGCEDRPHFQCHAGRQLRADVLVQTRQHIVDDRDGVAVADLDDADADRRLAVDARHLAEVGQVVMDGRDVLELDRQGSA
jgi:hypothetical protein